MIIERYDSQKAIDYAKRWALARNPKYFNFQNYGGDCTNFASQCLFAGSGQMNYEKTFGWYYINSSNRAPAWTGVTFFYNFLTTNSSFGPFGKVYHLNSASLGDYIQLQNSSEEFYHTLIVTKISNSQIYVSAHTHDALDQPLNSYNYKSLRLIKIDGVRK